MKTISQAIDQLTDSPHQLCIMDPQAGDIKTVWDSENPDEVAMARDQFNAGKKKGLVAYRVTKKGEKAEVMKDFDPAAEAIIMAPPVAGG